MNKKPVNKLRQTEIFFITRQTFVTTLFIFLLSSIKFARFIITLCVQTSQALFFVSSNTIQMIERVLSYFMNKLEMDMAIGLPRKVPSNPEIISIYLIPKSWIFLINVKNSRILQKFNIIHSLSWEGWRLTISRWNKVLSSNNSLNLEV